MHPRLGMILPHSRSHGTPYSALKVLMPRNTFHPAPHSAYTDCTLLQSAFLGIAVNANRKRQWSCHFSSSRCDFLPVTAWSEVHGNAFVTVPRAHFPLLCRSFSACCTLCVLTWGDLMVVTSGPFSLNAPFHWLFRVVPRSRKLTLWSIRLLKRTYF